jgi:hypothetical protein
MLFTIALKHIKPFLERLLHSDLQPPSDDEHDKALAAAIAISLVRQDPESNRGSTTNED